MKAKRVMAIILGVLLVTVLAGCGNSAAAEPTGTTYTLEITDGDTLEATVLPITSIDGAYAWNMMGMTKSTITLTVDENNYVYTVTDNTVEDKEDGMYFHRVYEFKGTCTQDGNKITLDTPTTVNVDKELGSAFAEYKDVWGEAGQYTQDDEVGAAVLEKWTGATAVVSEDGSLSFE